MRNTLAIVLAGLALAGATAVTAQDERRPERLVPELTVSGSGDVRVTPDLATVRLGVVRQGSTAKEAISKVNETAQKILTAVKAAGIDAKDIQTSQLTLNPVYQQKPNEEPRITSYQASNVVTVRIEKLTLTGPVIDAGLDAGANQLDSLSFGLRNDSGPRREALMLAAREARDKATTLADSLGVTLVRVINVQEGGGVVFPQPQFERAMVARGGAASTPVSQGEVQVTATVTLRYEIKAK